MDACIASGPTPPLTEGTPSGNAAGSTNDVPGAGGYGQEAWKHV